jgi:two-component system response regulator
MNAITSSRPIEILLVEDSATDVMLAEEALEKAKMRNNLHVVKDGVEAMAFLRQQGKYTDVPRPDLVLLDLNMPRKDGREVLAEVKEDDDLKSIPVVVLTTSQAQEDVLKAYGLHANCYISKPVDFQQFTNVVRAIDQFWFTVVTLPTGGNNG